MPSFIVPILWGLMVYLVGSVNWGFLVARWHGVDILASGNRNPGAANVFRTVGPLQGVVVYLADLSVGVAVVFPASWLPLPDVCRFVGAIMVIMGTAYPILLGFKGGTGLAKAMGVMLAINPIGFFLGSPLGILVVRRFHNAGWAGGIVAGFVLLFSALVYRDVVGTAIVATVGILVALRSLVQYRSP